MTVMPSDSAKQNLEALILQVSQSHQPIQIQAQGNAAVLVSEEDWRALQETVYLLSIPGMKESLLKGAATPLDECSEERDW